MAFYEQLEQLRENGANAVEDVLGRGYNRLELSNPALFDAVVRLVPYDQDSSVPIDRTAAIFVAAIDGMEPLPAFTERDLHLANIERKRDFSAFLNAEEMYQANRWPDLYETVERACTAQNVSPQDIIWLRKAIALLSHAIRRKQSEIRLRRRAREKGNARLTR